MLHKISGLLAFQNIQNARRYLSTFTIYADTALPKPFICKAYPAIQTYMFLIKSHPHLGSQYFSPPGGSRIPDPPPTHDVDLDQEQY